MLSEDTRLPNWAREGIRELERNVHTKTIRIEQLTDNPTSSLWYENYSDLSSKRIYLPKHDKIIFELISGERRSEISFSWMQDHSSMPPYVRCDAGWGQLIAESGGGSNILKLYPKNILEGWLTNGQ